MTTCDEAFERHKYPDVPKKRPFCSPLVKATHYHCTFTSATPLRHPQAAAQCNRLTPKPSPRRPLPLPSFFGNATAPQGAVAAVEEAFVFDAVHIRQYNDYSSVIQFSNGTWTFERRTCRRTQQR
eukprot:Filipodium_phascolosomae@DN2699_c0_g1_i3.p1